MEQVAHPVATSLKIQIGKYVQILQRLIRFNQIDCLESYSQSNTIK